MFKMPCKRPSTTGARPNSRRVWEGFAWLVALILPISNALATPNGWQSRASIRQAAAAFIAHSIDTDYPHHDITVSQLDPRLHLAKCSSHLETFLPPGGQLIGNTSVGVRCGGAKPWTLYVPTSVKAMRKVVVTRRPILRNTTIQAEDIRLEERDITDGSDAYIFDPQNVLGKLAKRPLPVATSLSPAMLSEPMLVKRGQIVIILAQASGFEVRMAGTALMDGAEGQIIRVKNRNSSRTVEGRVIQAGVIQVNM